MYWSIIPYIYVVNDYKDFEFEFELNVFILFTIRIILDGVGSDKLEGLPMNNTTSEILAQV